jgi:hypothetical protein
MSTMPYSLRMNYLSLFCWRRTGGSMTQSKQVPSVFADAYRNIDVFLKKSLGQDTSTGFRQIPQGNIVGLIEEFVISLSLVEGGRAELARRADFVSTACGTSDSLAVCHRALGSYREHPRRVSQSREAIGRLRRYRRDLPMWYTNVTGIRRDIHCVLTEGTLDLGDEARSAFSEWNDALWQVQCEACLWAVDGCWYLYQVHGYAEGSQSGNADAARITMEAKTATVHFRALWVAVSSIWEWVSTPDCTSSVAAPSPIAASSSGSVMLFRVGEAPVVNGVEQPVLTVAQHNVLHALLEAGEAGLTKDTIVIKSGHNDARGVLSRLCEKNSQWAKVIPFPRKAGGGYRVT